MQTNLTTHSLIRYEKKLYQNIRKSSKTSYGEESEQEDSPTCVDILFLHIRNDWVKSSFNQTLNEIFLSKLVITTKDKEDIDESQFDTPNVVNK